MALAGPYRIWPYKGLSDSVLHCHTKRFSGQ